MKQIKLLIIDVDGTLTDGKVYIAATGELMKAFNIKDGLMLARVSTYNIIPVIITGRKSDITLRRCEELNITEVYQGISDKVEQLKLVVEKYNCFFEEIAYIGDDINDLDCMKLCGITGCPADAIDEVRNIVSYVCKKNGGDGAVREFIEWLMRN